MEMVRAWQCQYCGKLYKIRAKRHCIKHEKYCKDNPENRHACFDLCENLEAGYEDIYDENCYEDEIVAKERTFTCAVTGKLMHSYIAERRGLPCVSCTDRMPLECEHFRSLKEDWE